ncbi:hypothetical protein D3C87_2068290 [compost metagenome]
MIAVILAIGMFLRCAMAMPVVMAFLFRFRLEHAAFAEFKFRQPRRIFQRHHACLRAQRLERLFQKCLHAMANPEDQVGIL